MSLEKKDTAAMLETYSTDSLNAARKMARSTSDKPKERSAYSKELVRESREMGQYIVGKRLSAAKPTIKWRTP